MRRTTKIKFWKEVPKETRKNLGEYGSVKDYITVHLFGTDEEMYGYAKSHGICESEDFGAETFCFISFRKRGDKVIISPQKAIMLFSLEHFGVQSVSHEVAHAVVGYFNRCISHKEKMLDIGMEEILGNEWLPREEELDLEELFAYMTGSLNNQIWDFYFKEIDKTWGNL